MHSLNGALSSLLLANFFLDLIAMAVEEDVRVALFLRAYWLHGNLELMHCHDTEASRDLPASSKTHRRSACRGARSSSQSSTRDQ